MDLSILGKMEGHALRSFMALSGEKKMRYVSLPGLKRRRKESVPNGQVCLCPVWKLESGDAPTSIQFSEFIETLG